MNTPTTTSDHSQYLTDTQRDLQENDSNRTRRVRVYHQSTMVPTVLYVLLLVCTVCCCYVLSTPVLQALWRISWHECWYPGAKHQCCGLLLQTAWTHPCCDFQDNQCKRAHVDGCNNATTTHRLSLLCHLGKTFNLSNLQNACLISLVVISVRNFLPKVTHFFNGMNLVFMVDRKSVV